MRLNQVAVNTILVLLAARIWAQHGSGSVRHASRRANTLTLTRSVANGHSPFKLAIALRYGCREAMYAVMSRISSSVRFCTIGCIS